MIGFFRDELAAAHGAGEEALEVTGEIVGRLRRNYPWVEADELVGYAWLGATLAGRRYDPSYNVPYRKYIGIRGRLLAIDMMRRDGILIRRNSRRMLTRFGELIEGDGMTLEDSRHGNQMDELANRDFCEHLLHTLPRRDRELAHLYYHEDRTFREIAGLQSTTESSICIRHKALLTKLKRFATRAAV